MNSKHIVMTTLGSLGDLHPFLAVALGLQERGHRVTIATSPYHGAKVESEGIGFHAVRPNITPDDKELMKLIMDAKKGGETVLRQIMFPNIRDTYADLSEAVRGADLLVTHPITYAGPIVAAKTGIRWVSIVLAPLSFFSESDPPWVAPLPGFLRQPPWGPFVNRLVNRLSRRVVRSWSEPAIKLRAELGIPTSLDPIFEGQHSPDLVLALFSPAFGPPQPDWPPQARAIGFVYYDRLDKSKGLPAELAQFLDAGPPPIVFTLGSSAVMDARDFYFESARAAAELGRRAILLVGPDSANAAAASPSVGIIAADYAPYSELFPRAAAIAHQGGAGTTAQALRAGRPMLVMPFAHDQHDNARCVVRLGVGCEIGRHHYRSGRPAAALRALLDNPDYASRAEAVGAQIRSEDGVAAACDLIEQQLSHPL